LKILAFDPYQFPTHRLHGHLNLNAKGLKISDVAGRCLWGIQQGRGAYSPDSGDTSGDDPVVDWFLRRKVFTVPLYRNHLDLEEREGARALRGKKERAYDVFEVLSDGMSI
jgi:hypothetical protein